MERSVRGHWAVFDRRQERPPIGHSEMSLATQDSYFNQFLRFVT